MIPVFIKIITSVEQGSDAAAAALTAALGAAGVGEGDGTAGMAIAADGTGAVALNDINDGTVLYIDPNDPQAAALLQQAGLMLSEDGTVQSIGAAEVNDLDASASAGVPQELLLQNTTEGELVETNTNNETNVSKQETINLPSAPDPNVRSKDIIEESLVSLSGFSAIAVQIPNPKHIYSINICFPNFQSPGSVTTLSIYF